MFSSTVVEIDPVAKRYMKGAEAYVHNSPSVRNSTIYICGDKKYWKKIFQEHDEIDVLTSMFSHESLHNVILDIESDYASEMLDTLFGNGLEYKNEYHGVLDLDKQMRKFRK